MSLRISSTMRPLRPLPMARCFSSTALAQKNIVPPESPSYIRLPTPPQNEDKKKERVRGFLPVPRAIFSRSEGDRRVRPEYFDETVPLPAKRSAPSNQHQQWRNKMAHARRRNLKSGLQALWERHNETEKTHTARVKAKFEEHRAAAQAPEREDDRITRSTVLGSLLDTKLHQDPKRFARADRSRSKILSQENAKREARRDALMELYINASNFITTESELKKEIDTVFCDDYFKKQNQAAASWGTENAWGVYGTPPTLADMLQTSRGKSSRLVDAHETDYDRSVKRQKKIAEEFTGGKME